jgi:outer membrane protein OmpA-like peptidoglycan-associated protein
MLEGETRSARDEGQLPEKGREEMTRVFVLLVGVALLGTGCVPLQTHKQTQDELAKAKRANEDLVKKYNDLWQRYLAKSKEAPATDPALLAELTALRARNKELEAAGTRFTGGEVAGVKGATPDPRGGITLGAALLFAEGSNKLRPEGLKSLDDVVQLLESSAHSSEMVLIEGHTDNQELLKTKHLWGTNMNLGYERAKAVFDYLLEHNIPEDRMMIKTCSFNDPTDSKDTSSEAARAKNRRVVFRRAGTKI